MVEVVSGRTQLRRASGSRFTGRCPFHEERTPSFSVNPVEKLYYCFGCGKGGDLISFVRETENLDFVGAIEWLAERFRVHARVRGVVAARRGGSPAAGAPVRRARADDRVLRAPALGGRHRRARARVPRRAGTRGRHRARVPARALAWPRPGGEGCREGVHDRRAPRCGPRDRARERLLPAAADVPARGRTRARGRLPGAQDPRGRSAAREVRQLARGRSLPQERDPVRAPPRADGDLEAGLRRRGRGQHRRDRAPTGGLRAGRRLDGDGADRAPAPRARAARRGRSTSASTPTRRVRRRPCAGWSSLRRRGSR